jgi:lysophospholipase L1-like esterase
MTVFNTSTLKVGAQAVSAAYCGAVSAYSALSLLPLFANDEQGVWFDPSDFSTMFQDSAGTTPVTAVGQQVGKMLDKSGNENHITLTSVYLRVDNVGRYYLESSSSSGVTSSINFSGTDKVSIFTAVANSTQSASATIARLGTLGSDAGSFDFGIYNGGIICYYKGSGSFGARSAADITNSVTVVSCVLDLAGTTYATECTHLRTNLSDPSLSNYGSTDSGSGNFGNLPITLFSGQGPYLGRMYGIVIRGAASSTEEIDSAESYFSTKAGVPMTNTLTPTSFTDTGAATDSGGGYYITSPFSSVDFTTTATELEISAFGNLYTVFPEMSDVGVFVNGAYHASMKTISGSSIHTDRVSLPSGSKTVSVVNGAQSKPSSQLLGVWVSKIKSNAAMTQVNLTPSNRILFYGDSITVGAFANPICEKAWVQQVRASYRPDSIATEAHGYRGLFNDAFDTTSRNAFVAKIVAYAPEVIWLATGTNDYGIPLQSAANFGTAYAALLDAIHVALPGAVIYCQSPTVRTSEPENSYGNTLGDYRTQISTAQSSRSSYATYINGASIVTTSELYDDVHLNNAGHVMYANYVKNILGI